MHFPHFQHVFILQIFVFKIDFDFIFKILIFIFIIFKFYFFIFNFIFSILFFLKFIFFKFYFYFFQKLINCQLTCWKRHLLTCRKRHLLTTLDLANWMVTPGSHLAAYTIYIYLSTKLAEMTRKWQKRVFHGFIVKSILPFSMWFPY